MPLIQNPDATQIIKDQAKLTIGDGYPILLKNDVQPVMDMTPRFHRNIYTLGSTSKVTSGAPTLFTADSNRKTYITGISLSITKDATCDVAIGSITVTAPIGGVSKTLAALSILTTTAQDKEYFIQFKQPVLIDKGGTVSGSTNTYTAGLMSRSYVIFGYESD